MTTPALHTRVLYDSPASEAYQILRRFINAENLKRGIVQSNQPVAIFRVDDAGAVIAGACGVVYPGWFSLDLLWVEESRRQRGMGAAILKEIEEEAVRLGAHSVYVWTQDFEAPDFYRSHGYIEFVQFDEFLPGHQLIGMQKKLV